MSCLAVNLSLVAVSKGLNLDLYDGTNHNIFEVSVRSKPQENDYISDVTISSDAKYLALITATSKELHVFSLPNLCRSDIFSIPRSASKIRFTEDDTHILVADKSGDALLYDIKKDENDGTKILGHLSLLLDILQTTDGKYIITSDRDEKIKVSCYPNTYNIQTYCMGHKEFVNNIRLLPHDSKCLVSSSGDGSVKLWDYCNGKLLHTIDTGLDINDSTLKEEFIKVMDEDGLQVSALPIVHFAVTLLNKSTSIIGLTVHNLNEIILYLVRTDGKSFHHKLKEKIKLKRFPADIAFNNTSLFVYDTVDCIVYEYKVSESDFSLIGGIKMFNDEVAVGKPISDSYEVIKMLYKRKFDNVQEYQERKKQRLEKQH